MCKVAIHELTMIETINMKHIAAINFEAIIRE